MKIDEKKKRPIFCYDKTSKVLYSTFNKRDYKEGYSFFCYGKMKKIHKFTENKVEHINTLCHCYYTPLKGMTRYFINEGDLWGEANAKCFVMNRIIKPKCEKCGGKMYKAIVHKCLKCKRK